MFETNPEWIAARRAADARDTLVAWLLNSALPLWWSVGTDHRGGGFFEKLDRSGGVVEEPRRTRVVGRQIYSFAAGAEIGWSGPVDAAIGHGVDFLKRYSLRGDGTVVSSVRPDGTVIDGRFDLYDHAFALFGLAAAFRRTRSSEIETIAIRMRDRMRTGWGHPVGGFEESIPRTLPLKANPHMHLFEAGLAWVEAEPRCGVNDWMRMVDEIGHLCLTHFIDPTNGALREFFDGDWRPLSGEGGRVVEPGHQFEWAWLMIRWGRIHRSSKAFAAARRLVEIASVHGTDPKTGLTINELWDDFSPKDSAFRLWPHTERIKAWLAMASIAETSEERTAALSEVAAAAAGLNRFLADDVPGSWNERKTSEGRVVVDAAPASSLYHITCAVNEMYVAPELRLGEQYLD